MSKKKQEHQNHHQYHPNRKKQTEDQSKKHWLTWIMKEYKILKTIQQPFEIPTEGLIIALKLPYTRIIFFMGVL